jgi:hypothetical protein
MENQVLTSGSAAVCAQVCATDEKTTNAAGLGDLAAALARLSIDDRAKLIAMLLTPPAAER